MKRISLFISLVCATALFMPGFASASESNNSETPAATEVKAAETCVVKGRIIDHNTSESLAGVAIRVCGSDKSVYTDLDGNYVLTGVAPGKCEIMVNMISYESKTVILNPEGNLTIDLSLNRK